MDDEDRNITSSDDFKRLGANQENKEIFYEHLNRFNWWRVSNYISPRAADELRNYKY